MPTKVIESFRTIGVSNILVLNRQSLKQIGLNSFDMAILFMDGFDHYSPVQMSRKWTYANSGTTTPGRYNGYGWVWNNVGTSAAGAYVDIPSSQTLIVSMAVSFDWGDATNPFLVLQDASNNTQVDLRVTSNAAIQVTRNGTVLDTTTDNLFPFGYWSFLEFRITCDAVNGAWSLKINGNVVSGSTGRNTRAQLSTLISRVRIQPISFASNGNYNTKFDDVYILDNSGTINNDFLGECRIQTNFPYQDGTQNDFVPKTGSTHWNMVNDNPSDDDFSYNAGGAVHQRELYKLTPFTFTGNIFGVQCVVTQRKDDVGNRSISVENRQSGLDYESSPDTCLSQYKMSKKLWQTNPATGLVWTLAQLNAAEFGLKVVS